MQSWMEVTILNESVLEELDSVNDIGLSFW